jgi:hypothetical protein
MPHATHGATKAGAVGIIRVATYDIPQMHLGHDLAETYAHNLMEPVKNTRHQPEVTRICSDLYLSDGGSLRLTA